MALRKGTQNIKRIEKGTTNIQRIYKGSTLEWHTETISNLTKQEFEALTESQVQHQYLKITIGNNNTNWVGKPFLFDNNTTGSNFNKDALRGPCQMLKAAYDNCNVASTDVVWVKLRFPIGSPEYRNTPIAYVGENVCNRGATRSVTAANTHLQSIEDMVFWSDDLNEVQRVTVKIGEFGIRGSHPPANTATNNAYNRAGDNDPIIFLFNSFGTKTKLIDFHYGPAYAGTLDVPTGSDQLWVNPRVTTSNLKYNYSLASTGQLNDDIIAITHLGIIYKKSMAQKPVSLLLGAQEYRLGNQEELAGQEGIADLASTIAFKRFITQLPIETNLIGAWYDVRIKLADNQILPQGTPVGGLATMNLKNGRSFPPLTPVVNYDAPTRAWVSTQAADEGHETWIVVVSDDGQISSDILAITDSSIVFKNSVVQNKEPKNITLGATVYTYVQASDQLQSSFGNYNQAVTIKSLPAGTRLPARDYWLNAKIELNDGTIVPPALQT